MSAAGDAAEQDETLRSGSIRQHAGAVDSLAPPPTPPRPLVTHQDAAAGREEESEEEEDEEPKLKYDKLTSRLSSLYRNGDSSSSLLVAGSKLVIGTHNGNVYVLDASTTQPLRTYQAHSATVTSCSVSPLPPPPTLIQRADGSGNAYVPVTIKSTLPKPTPGTKAKTATNTVVLPNTPDNAIFIATSSLDGNVCVFNLLDPKDVQLRNFARPVNTVALSPEYKSDRTYLSGGRAGQLILTKGGKAGIQADANTNSAAAAASGWLGSIGLGSNTGRDTVLHQGEGNISTVKWSPGGKWVAWVNEEGIKVMRSHLKLGNDDSDNAWKRINYAAKPNRRVWEEMAGVWKARAQWINEHALEDDPPDTVIPPKSSMIAKSKKSSVERLVVGWGDTTWILHVREGGSSSAGKTQVGSADIIHKLQFRDCVVSGVSMYSPSLLAILAYRTKDESGKKPVMQEGAADTPRRGRSHKHTGLAPQLRLINVHDGEELDVDELPMNRFETLSAQDYDFESVWIPKAIPEKTVPEGKGAMEGLWELSGGYYAQKMLSSSASVLSRSSSGFEEDLRRRNGTRDSDVYDVTPTQTADTSTPAHAFLLEHGLKLFVSSPYDCVVAMRRQAADHLDWLLQHESYAEAWTLVDKTPEVVVNSNVDQMSIGSGRTGQLPHQSLADFLGTEDNVSVRSAQARSSAAAAEKLRIGELWLTQLIRLEHWDEAGQIAAKVLQGSSRWEHWIITFARSNHYDEITSAVPSHVVHPSVPSIAYETLLVHYIRSSPQVARELVNRWEEGLFDASIITTAIKTRLSSGEVGEGSDQWLALLDVQGQLYVTLANPQEALKRFILTCNAERAFALLQEEKIADALSDNVSGFLTMKISATQLKTATLQELDDACSQAIQILVEEAHKNTLMPHTVIRQLQAKGKTFRSLLYFYLRTLWHGPERDRDLHVNRRMFNKTVDEGRAMVEDFADLAVDIFAEYDRATLMEFLEASEVYDYNHAASICDERKYIPELVLVLGRTGQTKRALWLIIGELGDASQAIAFVKQNPDLWEDLLEYGMDKPKFVRGLLAEVGTSIDPVKIVQRIPAGLEIAGLKQGILSLVQGWEVQLEVSRGVERVLKGEVLDSMETLRRGQRQGIRFEVVHETSRVVELSVVPQPGTVHLDGTTPGHCAGCDELFHEDDTQPLVGFTCGHVYHLSCILQTNPQGVKQANFTNTMSALGYGEEEPNYNIRSIGPKVMHAEIIRRAVDYGCQHCQAML